ncbi:hypothetical protein ACEZDB_27380 [Streptacidiphilus sp. N1-3]|uniref:Uncharacterized protein n=1 Tax=Streptacidiphilus alkalitolerans TaxID=3342712 RepID=A0ABV6X7U7_9ACTN
MALFLFILLVAVVFGFVGAIVKGLIWLLVIGCVLFVLALLYAGLKMGRKTAKTKTR